MHARGSRRVRRGFTNAKLTLLGTSAIALVCVPAARAADGGAGLAPKPVVGSMVCVKACEDAGAVSGGSTLRVSGRNFSGARSVRFNGAKGTRDDRVAKARRVTSRRLEVVVPATAKSGTVSVLRIDGQRSAPSRTRVTVVKPDGTRAAKLVSVAGVVDATVNASPVYFYGRRRASLHYTLTTARANDVRVDLVRTSDQVSVAHWTAYGVPAHTPQTVSWNGKSGARVPRAGTYEFRVAVGPQPRPVSGRMSPVAVQSSSAADPPPPARATRAGAFRYLPHLFPIRGAHSYGSGGARFGAGRAGHTHQGQDVMAACGTKLVAARGGTVQLKKYHSAAGNYLVIDTAGSAVDEVYMHLREPSPLQKGDKVYTGQLIGYVGQTGDARGCHLHFEMWSAPGWYEGGSPFDPLPSLQAWDKVS